MTPDQEAKLNELYKWMLERKNQQIAYPIDLVSQQILLSLLASYVTAVSAGSTTLTQTYTDSRGDTVTAPRHYTGSFVLLINGTKYEFGYIATPA